MARKNTADFAAHLKSLGKFKAFKAERARLEAEGKSKSESYELARRQFDDGLEEQPASAAGDMPQPHELLDSVNELFSDDKGDVVLTDVSADMRENQGHEETREPLGITGDSPGEVRMTTEFQWDPEQRQVVEADVSARLLVVAPPGTGKTAVACGRAAHLISEQGINSSNILIVSFTRTAVAEIRQRIEGYCGAVKSSTIRISTIDSTAWSFQQGFPDSTNRKGSGGELSSSDFNLNIEKAVVLLQNNDPDLLEYLAEIEHILIDEAQDVRDIRATFIKELVNKTNEQCGFTILADPLQAIYDFTSDVKIDPKKYVRSFATGCKEVRLQNAHRYTNSEFANLIAKAREIVDREDITPIEQVNNLSHLLDNCPVVHRVGNPDKKDLAKKLKGKDDTLVLFRGRADVLEMSSYLCQKGTPHRIRMSGLPDCLFPWIGRVFSDNEDSTLSRSGFLDLYDDRVGDDNRDQAFETLFRISRKGKDIDMRTLRERLSRKRPPVEACFLDCGTSGPIVGTVHASKGREAERVLFFVPSIDDNENTEEELRVLYVGATRSKDTLALAKSDGMKFTTDLAQDGAQQRRFKFDIKYNRDPKKPGKACFLEVGHSTDLELASVVSSRVCNDKVTSCQEDLWTTRTNVVQLAVKKQEKLDWKFCLYSGQLDPKTKMLGPNTSLPQGWFSDRFAKRGNGLAAAVSRLQKKYRIQRLNPSYIHYSYRVAVRTVVMGQDDPQLKDVTEPFRTSGFFLVPVVRGWCRVLAFPPGKKKT